jgi:hypothetical protein
MVQLNRQQLAPEAGARRGKSAAADGRWTAHAD